MHAWEVCPVPVLTPRPCVACWSACCSPAQRAHVADLMRRHGVRRANAEKNVGSAKYAFNKVQKYFLPQELRPPSGTGGRGVVS